MDKALGELIKISNSVGKDRTLVQGGGGNTSVKSDDGKYMFIKASGTALKSMDEKNGWRRLSMEMVLSIIEDNGLGKIKDVDKRENEVVNRLSMSVCDNLESSARPSVEAHLHAMLDKYVIHLHPDAICSFASAKNGKEELMKVFKEEKMPPLWVPYADPGYKLAVSIKKLVAEYEKEYCNMPKILVLEKHGLFVTAGSYNKALSTVKTVIKKCSAKLVAVKKVKVKAIGEDVVNESKLAIRKAFFDATGSYININYFMDEDIAGFMKHKDVKTLLRGNLTPDELVYANGPAVWVDGVNSAKLCKVLSGYVSRGQKVPVAFLVKDEGLFIAGPEKMAVTINDIMHSSFFIRNNTARMGGLNALNKRESDFINNWESETFRKSGGKMIVRGELHDRIAVVTGGGSGLGRAISVGLARAGAKVIVVDIDIKGAEETARLIMDEMPIAEAFAVKCDVISEESVESVFNAVLCKWGGVDVLVNAAGVAPAFALVDMPVDKWRFALEVNLTGYMLMAKHAARIMILQGMGGAIVNISSKSGVEASKNNSAYNATKAGELHLTRGWAMELGGDNIRVNSVCPGNVFEGSKIWNPEYIKTCAKKYGIKQEEVIPFYVSKTMLNREIMGQDIADSVVFLASDKARRITAQTLVTDGGQASVR